MRGADRTGAWACCAAYSPSWTKPLPSGMLGTLSSSNRTERSRDCVTNWRGTPRQRPRASPERRLAASERAPAARERAPETAAGGRAPRWTPASRSFRQGPAAGSRRPSRTAARCALWPAGAPPVSGAGRRDLGSAGPDDLSGLRRRGERDRRGVAVSGRPSPGAPAGAPLRHRGRPLLAVSAAYPGPARPADLRRVGGSQRTARPRCGRAGRRVAHAHARAARLRVPRPGKDADGNNLAASQACQAAKERLRLEEVGKSIAITALISRYRTPGRGAARAVRAGCKSTEGLRSYGWSFVRSVAAAHREGCLGLWVRLRRVVVGLGAEEGPFVEPVPILAEGADVAWPPGRPGLRSPRRHAPLAPHPRPSSAPRSSPSAGGRDWGGSGCRAAWGPRR